MNLPQLNKSGFILLDKPAGITSHHSLSAIKRRTHLKVGHTGTLDPMATGAMVVALGDATKFSRWIIQQKKCYSATIQLGSQTDSDDKTGQPIKTGDIKTYSLAEIESILQTFKGTIVQTPPRYSAIHISGKRAYELARSNQEFDVPQRTVKIDNIKLLHYSPAHGKITFDITCQSGTYIRSIARDFGEKIGCPAHLHDLHRHWIAPFITETYRPAEEIQPEHIIDLSEAFKHLEHTQVSNQQVIDLYHGKIIQLSTPHNLAVFNKNQFIGIVAPIDNESCKSIKLVRQNKDE